MLFICPFIGRGAGPGFVVMRVLEEGTAKFLFRYWSVSSSSSRRAKKAFAVAGEGLSSKWDKASSTAPAKAGMQQRSKDKRIRVGFFMKSVV